MRASVSNATLAPSPLIAAPELAPGSPSLPCPRVTSVVVPARTSRT
jgi:hypothetical protein